MFCKKIQKIVKIYLVGDQDRKTKQIYLQNHFKINLYHFKINTKEYIFSAFIISIFYVYFYFFMSRDINIIVVENWIANN